LFPAGFRASPEARRVLKEIAMNRSFLGFALLLLLGALPAACGNGGSDDPVGPTPNDDAGSDAGCGPAEPAIACETPCGGGTTPPECVNGGWQCPDYAGYGECPIEPDAGDDDAGGCAGPAPACHLYCVGEGAQPVCIGNLWTCDYTACIEDSGEPDAPSPIDASDPPFACGDTACDPDTSYCEIFSGGPVPEDGGTSTTYSCEKLPSSCSPGAATCACVGGFQGAGCGCIAQNGKVIETCDVP
jgi:hypothetical protein